MSLEFEPSSEPPHPKPKAVALARIRDELGILQKQQGPPSVLHVPLTVSHVPLTVLHVPLTVLHVPSNVLPVPRPRRAYRGRRSLYTCAQIRDKLGILQEQQGFCYSPTLQELFPKT